MTDELRVKAKKALRDARAAAHAVIDDVSLAAHNTLVGTEADVQKVSEEMKTSVHKAVTDAKGAAHEARTQLRKRKSG
jgi:gas vesicle protein